MQGAQARLTKTGYYLLLHETGFQTHLGTYLITVAGKSESTQICTCMAIFSDKMTQHDSDNKSKYKNVLWDKVKQANNMPFTGVKISTEHCGE